MSHFKNGFIPGDTCMFIPNATLYHFGMLTSAMHMAWVRQVCGRLKSDYRYSKHIVYNNYPWPQALTEKQRLAVEAAAQAVLDARAQLPKPLLDAHRTLDRAVDKCYRSAPFPNELARLQFLFELYRQYTEPLLKDQKPPKASAKRKK